MTVDWPGLARAFGICLLLACGGAGIAVGIGWIAGKYQIVLPIMLVILLLVLFFTMAVLGEAIEL